MVPGLSHEVLNIVELGSGSVIVAACPPPLAPTIQNKQPEAACGPTSVQIGIPFAPDACPHLTRANHSE